MLKRLTLQLERDLMAQAGLRRLLAAADAAVVGHRQDLRAVKARIRLASPSLPGVLPSGGGIPAAIAKLPAMLPLATRHRFPRQGRNR